VNRYAAALRRAAEVIDVPGTPRSLRLDNLEVSGDRVRLWWSFIDPEVLPGDREPHRRRIRGELEVAMERGRPAEVATSWWAEAQLAAGRRYALQIDADWEPGEPYVRRVWSTDEAWQALLSHLGGYGAEVRVDDGTVRVVQAGEETVYVIDPEEWAAFLTDPEAIDPDGSEIVPVATPLVDGLPLWAADELAEAAGAWGPVVGLVGGRLVGLDLRDR
jgi:hypothetical protein